MDLLMIVFFVIGGLLLVCYVLPLLFFMRPLLLAIVLWGAVLGSLAML